MADWDTDSAQLQSNLRAALASARTDARARTIPTLETVRGWHNQIMHNLKSELPDAIGRFRGEAGLENCNVAVGGRPGTDSQNVRDELNAFETRLQTTVEHLDNMIAPEAKLDADRLLAVLDLCAWAHAEWVRIHPFANGNGRTARIWANYIAMRYGLPPFVRLRPRPNRGYGRASAAAMAGQWRPTARLFRAMFADHVRITGA